jgi:hypothetical protein
MAIRMRVLWLNVCVASGIASNLWIKDTLSLTAINGMYYMVEMAFIIIKYGIVDAFGS